MYRLFKFLLAGLLWFAVSYWLGQRITTLPLWAVTIAVLLIATPIGLSGIYASTILQLHRLQAFHTQGWVYRLLAGRALRVLGWLCWALLSSFAMLIQIRTFGHVEWWVLAVAIPLFWLIFNFFQWLFTRSVKHFLVTGMTLIWARRATTLTQMLIYFAALSWFSELPVYMTLDAAIDAQRLDLLATGPEGGSYLVHEASRQLAVYDGAKAYAVGHIGQHQWWLALGLFALGSYALFFNVSLLLGAFMISRAEYRRIFIPLSENDPPASLSRARIAVIAGVTSFLILFITTPMVAYIEASIAQNPAVAETGNSLELRLEQIDDQFFRAGTSQKLLQAKFTALRNIDKSQFQLEAEVDRAFDAMEHNVDRYLDWYYSLPAEYGRIAALLQGGLNFEHYMADKLAAELQQGDLFQPVNVQINTLLATYQQAEQQYQQQVEQILADHHVEMPPGAVVSLRLSSDDTLLAFSDPGVISLQHRVAASGGAAAAVATASAVVANKIVAKAVSKNLIQFSAKALTKVVTSKTISAVGGTTAGATGGAILGSALPGTGTAIGAVVGGIVGGILTGLTVDKLLLELEEAMNREIFRQKLVMLVNDQRMEFKQRLNLGDQ